MGWIPTIVAIATAAAPAPARIDLRSKRRLAECDALVRRYPRHLDAYRCYWVVGMRARALPAAAARLRRMLGDPVAGPRARLYLGMIEVIRTRPAADDHLRAAAVELHAQKEHRGEVYARTTLGKNLARRGRLGEAHAQLRLAAQAAAAAQDRSLVGMVHLWRGQVAQLAGDYAEAGRWFQRAERRLDPSGPRWLRRWLFYCWGDLYRITGRHRQAYTMMRRELAVIREDGNLFTGVWTLMRMASAAGHLVEAGLMSGAERDRLAQQALEAARRRKNRVAEADVRLWLYGAHLPDPLAAARHLEWVLALGRKAPDFLDLPTALRMLGKARFHADPRRASEAFRLVDEAISLARARGRRWQEAEALVDRAYLRWRTGPRDRARRESLEALSLIARMRGRQAEYSLRARVGAMWAYAYYLFSGALLRGASPGDAGDLDLAFRIQERLRARTLLESLSGARRSTRRKADRPLVRRRRRLLAEISAVQKRLLRPELPAPTRSRALARLRRLESEEEGLRDRLARAHPPSAALLAEGIPSLRTVQAELPMDTALLVFQVPPPAQEARLLEETHSWVLVLTHQGTRAYRLPHRPHLRRAVHLWQALLRRRNGAERSGSVGLYRALLGRPLASLPLAVRRLVIVADGPLHGLSFGALRSSPGAPVLALRFVFSRSPSVALWRRWHRSRARLSPAVLALADPALPSSAARARLRSAAPWVEGLRLGRLPGGRVEAEEAVRALGGGSALREGSRATEAFLKRADLGRWGVLHLAAHAVVDETIPERSAVVLSAGSSEEDGLLQVREVTDLPLHGQVVVLSACGSSAGAVLPGEGVMSLARAFLQAGAGAVVGSLWPLRDDEAQPLVAALYRHLAEGRSVAAALAAARRDLHRAGAPAAAWAGLVVIGDGRATPGAARRASVATWALPGGGAGLLGIALLTLLVLRRRRQRFRGAGTTPPAA